MGIPTAYLTESLVYLCVGAAVSFPLLLLNVKVAPRLGLIDWPKARGVAEDQIPLVGHSLVLITLGALSVLMSYYPVSPWFLTTAIVMAMMGHMDDRKPLPPLDKLFFQLVCVSCVVYLDPQIYTAITLKYGRWGSAWAIFFLMGLVNAVNFIDGIDGLAGIVILTASVGFILLSHGAGDSYPYFVISSVFAGMMIPFLYLNVLRRKGFLGNVGSYFFSYTLGMMYLSLPSDASGILPRLSISGLCFLIPIADAATVVLTRLFTGRSPFFPDRGHLHHRLVQTSIPLRYILLCFWILETLAMCVAVMMNDNPGIRTSLLPIVACSSHVAMTALLILLVEKASRKRLQGYFERLDANEPIHFIKYRLRRTDGVRLSLRKLRRIEAHVAAEIRISDVCFSESPDLIFVTLKASLEPVKSITARVEAIFHNEAVELMEPPDEGQYIKTSFSEARPGTPPLRRVK